MKRMAITLLICLASAGSALAMSYTGSISYDDGLTGTAIWDTGTLSWTVDDESVPGMWRYAYTFTVQRKAPSHVLLETAAGFTVDNVGPGSTPGSELKLYGPEDRSNPGLPGELYGLKWEAQDSDRSFSWTLVSDRAPAWVDYYARDGKHREEWVFAHNTGFGDEPADLTVGDGNNGGWVLGPGVTAEEQAILSFAAESFNRIRALVAPDETSPAQARMVGNHVEVSSENWTYVLDSAGHQVFRPAAVYPHLKATFDTDLAPILEEWLELPVSPDIISHAREMALAAFGANYFDNPDIRVVTKRDVLVSRGPDMEVPSFHEGRTYVIFSDESRAAGTAETSILYTPEGQTLHLECSLIDGVLTDIVPVFQYGLAEGLINSIFRTHYQSTLRLGTFFSADEARFPLTANSYRGEAFLTWFPVGPCDPGDYTCNPYAGFIPLDLCYSVALPWPMWYHRSLDQHRFSCWDYWNRYGRVGGFTGNYDWSAGQWEMTDRESVINKALTEYGISGGVEVQINNHLYCEGHPDELVIDLMATHGNKLDDQFYEDLESCHVAMFNTHSGPLDPDPGDGVSYYTHHMLRGFRDDAYDDWLTLHQPDDDGLGRGQLRHVLLEGCESMNWIKAKEAGRRENLFQDWFNTHVADGIRTVCGADEEYIGGDNNGWLFFRHYNINASISHAWAMHALDLNACKNFPVTVAYGATLDEAASIVFDGRFSQQRGNTGWIIAVETFTVDCQ